MSKADQVDNKVLGKTILIAGITIAVLLVIWELVHQQVFPGTDSWSKGVKTAVSLLVFWLVITSSLRAMNKMRKNMDWFKLIGGGVGIATLGIVLFLVTLQFLNWLEVSWAEKPKYALVGFYAGGAFIVSLLSLINLRVKSKMMGNVLEFLVIALVAYLFFRFTR
ncbi:MAG: hypothetical protein HRU41_27325 [Saprospiraceae bacterium]|nr:hypothetical protein [Saprospiraceae bacterium]